MYVILTGEVEVSIVGEYVAKLGAGSFFGELALLTESPRTANVSVSSEECETVFLSRAVFDCIKVDLGESVKKEILRRIENNYGKQRIKLG